MALHANLTTSDIHTPFRWLWANEAARLAQSVVNSDVHKIGIQEDTGIIYRLVDTTPTWAPIGGEFTLNQLADVEADSPNHGDILVYDSINNVWESVPFPQSHLVEDDATNTVTDVVTLVHQTTNTPTVGFGVGTLFSVEDPENPNTNVNIGRISMGWFEDTFDPVNLPNRLVAGVDISLKPHAVNRLESFFRLRPSWFGSVDIYNVYHPPSPLGMASIEIMGHRGRSFTIAQGRSGHGSTLVGGANHIIFRSGGGVILGGGYNTLDNAYESVILGGNTNTCFQGLGNTIINGERNKIEQQYENAFLRHSVILAGRYNEIFTNFPYVHASYNLIASGYQETIDNSQYSFIGPGRDNTVKDSSFGFIGGGYGNFLENASYNVILGGKNNKIQGISFGTILNGEGAVVSNRGQVVVNNGTFAEDGDNQTTLAMVLRRQIEHEDDGWFSLYLDGDGELINIPENSVWVLDIFLVGTISGQIKRVGFLIKGIVSNDGTTTEILTEDKTLLYTDDTTLDCRLNTSGTNLLLEVRKTGGFDPTPLYNTIRWVATLRTVEVTFP